jgi:cytochrome c-type biogenesis protein CcmH
VRLLVVALAALALAAPASACTHPASQGHLETLLVCPSCHTTLDESTSPAANEIRAEVKQLIAQCKTEKQILDAMVAEWGETILSTPQTHGFDLLAWVLPLGGILAGAAALAAGARAWSRTRREPPVEQGSLSAEDEQRVDDALARFE